MGSTGDIEGLMERLLSALKGVPAEHTPGEVIETCGECGDVVWSYDWVDLEDSGLGRRLMPCAYDCSCKTVRESVRLKREQAERARAARLRCFRYMPPSIDAQTADIDLWGDGEKQLRKLGNRLLAAFDGTGKAEVGFTVSGATGIGKTYLLLAIANRCIELGVETRLISMTYLFERIKTTFGAGQEQASEATILKDVTSARVILIDELGLGKRSEWTYEVLYKLIDRATASGRTIACATNLDDKELKKYLRDPWTGQDRLSQRLFKAAPVVLVSGKNFRSKQEHEAAARLNE